MGRLFGGRVSSGESYTVNPTNPNPLSFHIIKSLNVGKYWITDIRYPNCTNYEGRKILLSTKTLDGLKEIDPHFTENCKYGLIARFCPTQDGWAMASRLALHLSSIR